MRIPLYLSILTLSLLTSCASILSTSTYPVVFDSSPSGAEVTIRDGVGNAIFKGKTPTTLTLSASEGFWNRANYTVEARMPGYNPGLATLDARLDGWYFGNIIFGGLLGILIVDPATGAMWKLDRRVTVVMGAQAVSALNRVVADAPDASLRIVSLADVPTELRPYLRQLD